MADGAELLSLRSDGVLEAFNHRFEGAVATVQALAELGQLVIRDRLAGLALAARGRKVHSLALYRGGLAGGSPTNRGRVGTYAKSSNHRKEGLGGVDNLHNRLLLGSGSARVQDRGAGRQDAVVFRNGLD